jgi:hypothetical protein
MKTQSKLLAAALISYSRRKKMTLGKYLAGIATLALTLSLGAFAKDTNSGKFNLDNTARIGSTQLAPGHYKAEWSGPANDVKVNILDHGKVVATAHGKIENLPRPSPYDATTVKAEPDHSNAVDEIQFSNRSQELVLQHGM